MKIKLLRLTILVAAAAAVSGCVHPQPTPPTSLPEYDKMLRKDPHAFTEQIILLHNIQRVLDKDLPPAKRVESLKLADRLGGGDPQVRAQFASILTEPDNPPALKEAVLTFLLKKDYPELAAYVVKSLPQVSGQAGLRDAILQWLARHPDPAVLANVVKLWADEPSISGPNEPRYRLIVQQITSKPWDEALLDAINSERFFARGSAMEVLAHRVDDKTLRRRVKSLTARTDAVAAMQTFLDNFDFLPTNGAQLLASVYAYKKQQARLMDAARLTQQWTEDYGYRFNIRDFHLLSRMSTDPLRTILRRTRLILQIGRAVTTRKHVHHKPSKYGAVDDYLDRFTDQVDNLTMADLWNLYLLNEMLSRPRIQMALRIMATRDRADNRTAWGGLVFYENGTAEAKYYPSPQEVGEDDLHYRPSKQAVSDGRDAMCRFHAHFEKVDNARRAGPGADELIDARAKNYYGLILTSLGEDRFCAHYYTPAGVVVSLGVFPFRQ